MTRLSLLNSPLLLGFEDFERTLDRVQKSSDGYPPYNIERLGDDGIRITLAVAGFTEEDLSVQVEDNQLSVRGRIREDDKQRVYLYRGIAARQFQKTFVLADGIEVVGAWLDNGLLNIDLAKPEPATRVRTIEISRPKATTAPPTVDVRLGEDAGE